MDDNILEDILDGHETALLPKLTSSTLTQDPNVRHGQHNPQAGLVIAKIEDILELMVDCLLQEKNELVIELKSNRRKRAEGDSLRPNTLRRSSSGTTLVRFPGKNEREAWKFSEYITDDLCFVLSHQH